MAICKNCGKPLILRGGKCIYCKQSPDSPSGLGEKPPVSEGPIKTESANRQNPLQQKPNKPVLTCNQTVKNWISGICLFALVILICIYLGSLFSGRTSPSQDKITESIENKELHPQDISGNYYVRMMNSREDVNAAIKIYSEGGNYAMNVYSANITKKYSFSYDPSNGEIFSKELGKGDVRLKELTNEIEITFEGWKLVK